MSFKIGDKVVYKPEALAKDDRYDCYRGKVGVIKAIRGSVATVKWDNPGFWDPQLFDVEYLELAPGAQKQASFCPEIGARVTPSAAFRTRHSDLIEAHGNLVGSVVDIDSYDTIRVKWDDPDIPTRWYRTHDLAPAETDGLKPSHMRRFHLVRTEDESGVSGTGIVAEGVQFATGWCALSWLTQFQSVGLYPSVDELVRIHGHGGRTTVKWLE